MKPLKRLEEEIWHNMRIHTDRLIIEPIQFDQYEMIRETIFRSLRNQNWLTIGSVIQGQLREEEHDETSE